MVIRSRNSIAVQRITNTDAQLYSAEELNTVAISDGGQVPLLDDIRPLDALATGTFVARNIAYIEHNSYHTVLDSTAASIPGLFKELLDHGPVYGAHMPWGFFQLDTLLPLRYVNGLLLYFETTSKQILQNSSRAAAEADTIVASLQEGDDVGLGKSRMVDPSALSSYLSEQMAEQAADFDRHFLAMEKHKFKGYQLPAYKLPSTFYMTTYRCQMAESNI